MSSDHLRRKFRRIIRICFFVMAGLLSAGVMFLTFVPHLDGPHSRRAAHEAIAVGELLTVVRLQSKYAAADAVKGFACELPLLQSAEQKGDHPDYDPLGFLTTGTWAGYRFTLDGCQVDKNGTVVHYQVSAAPVERGVSGLRSFCTDETGVIRYDNSGIGTNCLTSGRVLD